jgi:hypothetical protein
MSDVFRKTTLGYEEIASRARGLSPRLRRCLILINGKRSFFELTTLLPSEDLATLVQTLELEGYVALAGAADDANGNLNQSKAVLSMDTVMETGSIDFDHSQPMFIDSTGKMRRQIPFKERQLRGSRVINDLLGPNAEGIALRIEKCKDDATLELVLKMAAAFIADTVGHLASQRFKDHVRLKNGA